VGCEATAEESLAVARQGVGREGHDGCLLELRLVRRSVSTTSTPVIPSPRLMSISTTSILLTRRLRLSAAEASDAISLPQNDRTGVLSEVASSVLVVLHDEQARTHLSSCGASPMGVRFSRGSSGVFARDSGKVTLNVLPTPFSLSTGFSPPSNSQSAADDREPEARSLVHIRRIPSDSCLNSSKM
jgi:hypothetical protein